MGLTVLAVLASVTAPGLASAQPAGGASAVPANPNALSSGELVENPEAWDGKIITFTGEAITQAMVRGDHAWIHLNDDAYYKRNVEEGAALGGYNSGHAVWLRKELADKISFFGDYRHQGDVVTVRGTFNAACAQHGGDMDIHADQLDIAAVGRVAKDPVKPWKIVLALGLSVTAAGMWWADRRIGHLESKGLRRT
jgi:hypothetical protein